jgi:hypothetical protein
MEPSESSPVIPASSVSKLDAYRILDILERALHASPTEWLFFRELRVGTGVRNSAAQRLDAYALNCLPHLGMRRVCYELKTSRSDFLNELRAPLKRRIGMRYSNEFYFVTPPSLLRCAEIPAECGLIECGLASRDQWTALLSESDRFVWFDPEEQSYCQVRVPAPWRDTPGPTWQLVAAMVRNQRRRFEEKPPPPPKQQKLELTSPVDDC